MLISYPACFYSVENGYYVYFPDIGGSGTQGDTIPDAIAMASDYLGMMLSDDIEHQRTIHQPSPINTLSLEDNNPFRDDDDFNFNLADSFVSMVNVELNDYLGTNTLVKKTVTIPKWSDELGKKNKLNFSKTMTDAIVEKSLHVLK